MEMEMKVPPWGAFQLLNTAQQDAKWLGSDE